MDTEIKPDQEVKIAMDVDVDMNSTTTATIADDSQTVANASDVKPEPEDKIEMDVDMNTTAATTAADDSQTVANASDADDDVYDTSFDEIEIKPELLQVDFVEGTEPIATPGNILRDTCTSESCFQSTKRHCNKFTEESRRTLFDYFWGLPDEKARRKFVNDYVDRGEPKERKKHSRRQSSFYYHLPLNGEKTAVCKTMFVNTLVVGNRAIRAWLPILMHDDEEEESEEVIAPPVTKRTRAKRKSRLAKEMEESTEAVATASSEVEKPKKESVADKPVDVIPPKELEYYNKLYEDLGFVTTKRIHCTVCRTHIGTAPAKLNVIHTHPILKVSLCKDCYDFYDQGEFIKGEDGSEYYCRWCGQGGDVFCCSDCSFVFCQSCIKYNLSEDIALDIERNDLWQCFNCAPKILWPLRAQNWAVKKFMLLQEKAISAQNWPPNIMKELMSRDSSSCCKKELEQSPAAAKTRKRKSVNSSETRPAKKPNNQVVVTPDIANMFKNQFNASASNHTIPLKSLPSKANIGLIGKPKPAPAQFRAAAPVRKKAPLYHTIHGFKIDLNAAINNSTIRLPNGKLIQVKKTFQNDPNRSRPVSQYTICAVREKPQKSKSTVVLTKIPAKPPQRSPHNIQKVESKSSPYSIAKSELDKEVESCKSVCQHLASKIKTVNGYQDYTTHGRGYKVINQLYTHEAYLLSYSIGRLQLLQEQFRNNLRDLGFPMEADNLEKGKLAEDNKKYYSKVDEDFEIVEPNRDIIELGSDDDDDSDRKESKSAAISKSVIPTKGSLGNVLNDKPTIKLEKEEILESIDLKAGELSGKEKPKDVLSNAKESSGTNLEITMTEKERETDEIIISKVVSEHLKITKSPESTQLKQNSIIDNENSNITEIKEDIDSIQTDINATVESEIVENTEIKDTSDNENSNITKIKEDIDSIQTDINAIVESEIVKNTEIKDTPELIQLDTDSVANISEINDSAATIQQDIDSIVESESLKITEIDESIQKNLISIDNISTTKDQTDFNSAVETENFKITEIKECTDTVQPDSNSEMFKITEINEVTEAEIQPDLSMIDKLLQLDIPEIDENSLLDISLQKETEELNANRSSDLIEDPKPDDNTPIHHTVEIATNTDLSSI